MFYNSYAVDRSVCLSFFIIFFGYFLLSLSFESSNDLLLNRKGTIISLYAFIAFFSRFAAKLLQIPPSRTHSVRIRQRALKFSEFVALPAPSFVRLGCRRRRNFCGDHVRLYEKPC